MTGFHNFTVPLWEIFSGNLLFLFCSLFYLIWWVVSFRPNSSGGTAGVLCITAAFITGIAAIAGEIAGSVFAIDGLGHDPGERGLADPADS